MQTIGYRIRYSYKVRGELYRKDLIIGTSSDRFLDFIFDFEDCPVEVYYRTDDPSRSYLNTNPGPEYYKAIARQAKSAE